MSKIQFNLLPDLKLQYNKVQRVRKTVNSIAVLVSLASLAIFLLMLLTVDVVQKKQMSDAGKELDSLSKQLNSIPQLNTIVTVQNQLQSLPALHQSKHITSRVFTFLPQLTPASVSINKLNLDLKENTWVISGTADSQQTINSFVDTLKATTYKVGQESASTKAFPSVLESGFSINPKSVNYTISMTVDPKLFANNLTDSQGKTIAPQLVVPNYTNNTPGAFNSTFFGTPR
jgi:Tfp pilus assembly protein PilN